MRAFVRLRCGHETRELIPGEIIGRIWTAAFPMADPFVSEAHAYVSLRSGALKLMGLRGRLAVGGKTVPEVTLTSGLEIALSTRTVLTVEEVSTPSTMLALSHPVLGRRPLTATVSLVTRPHLDLVAGVSPDAAALIWSDGLSWFARRRDGADVTLDVGVTLEVEGERLEVVMVSMRDMGESTLVDPASLDSDLHLVLRYDTVHIHRDGTPTVTLDGLIARIVSELASAGVPMGWQALATDLWRGVTDVPVLRRNWDASIARLRKKLREAHIRVNLIRADRSGNFEIFLLDGDRVDDQT